MDEDLAATADRISSFGGRVSARVTGARTPECS